MRRVGVITAAFAAAWVSLCAGHTPANELADLIPIFEADDDEDEDEDDAHDGDDAPQELIELLAPPEHTAHLHPIDRYVFFAGYDLWRNGGIGHGGMLWSPGGIHRSGFTLKVLLAGGLYRYRSHGREIVGRQAVVSVMPGWRVKQGHADVTLFAGLDVQGHLLTPDDLDNKLRGIRNGVRLGADVWYQPTSHLMINAGLSVSTLNDNFWARIAGGWYAGNAWIGPEAIKFGDVRYWQTRIGVHATGLRFGAFEWSVGVGHVRDPDTRHGVYARFGMLARQ